MVMQKLYQLIRQRLLNLKRFKFGVFSKNNQLLLKTITKDLMMKLLMMRNPTICKMNYRNLIRPGQRNNKHLYLTNPFQTTRQISFFQTKFPPSPFFFRLRGDLYFQALISIPFLNVSSSTQSVYLPCCMG